MMRQSPKRGAASVLVIFSMKALWSIGANSPERFRSASTTLAMLRAISASAPCPRNSGIAIGMG